MTIYSAESFYRARISTSITSTTAAPITIVVTSLPTVASWLLTISPNTEYEEIVEYGNINSGNMTIDITKRGIKPSSILLTSNWVDYNNTTYYRSHTQNDIIRGDVNHIHVNQGIGNSTLATNLWVGISKLSVAAVDAGDPIVVGDNDPRLIPIDASTTVKWLTKLSVAPVSAANPIAVGDNDGRVAAHTIASANGFAGTVSGANAHTISTTVTWLLKWNGTAMSAATAGTDYYAPSGTDVAVADGGTWRSSHTAYAPIFWGTTTTSAQQSGTVGNSWEVMTSNWAWALPTFKPWIVKNGTYTTISASVWAYSGWLTGPESGTIANPTVAVVSIYSLNGTWYLEQYNWSWTTLYENSSYGTTLTFTFMLKEWINYRCRCSSTPWGSAAVAVSLAYTV